MELRLIVDNTVQNDVQGTILPGDVAYFDLVIERTRAQLLEDLSYYRVKIDDLTHLDPHNRTGLMTLYRAHEQHILRLLGMIGDHLRAVDATI